MKTSRLVVITLLTVVGGLLLWERQHMRAVPQKEVTKVLLMPKVEKKTVPDFEVPKREVWDQKKWGKPPEQQHYAVVDGKMVKVEGGVIAQMAKAHPELGLTPDKITKLQSIHTEYNVKRSRMEVALATITQVSSTETFVEIPAYAESEGKDLWNETVQTINATGWASDQLVQDMYSVSGSGYYGKAPQIMTITTHPPEGYKVVEMRYYNESTASTVDIIPKGNLGRYASQQEFLPKGGI